MRNHVRHSRSERSKPAFEEGEAREPLLASLSGAAFDRDVDAADVESADAEDGDEAFDDELADVVRLSCPDCGRPIAVLADEDELPEHALCPTPWNPFGLTVCPGSGRAVAEARPLDAVTGEEQSELVVVLTLPAGLDWRTQPFSHVGGPGSRPLRTPGHRLAA
ncbi:hypothetical protein V2S66_12755 [Streptomyces sp. V4-01]|uniref:Uncharacterized protein n=1 Tax=Actinacidiphila polyblastidii TaxID=3110430 RepID=A0ABU7PAI6_9ACTN|nr:hypothetical protein [Streptomyces sp. V4-01]